MKSKKMTRLARRNKGYSAPVTPPAPPTTPPAEAILAQVEQYERRLQDDVVEFRKIVCRLEPSCAIRFAQDKWYLEHLGVRAESSVTEEGLAAQRLLEYLHAVYAASPPSSHFAAITPSIEKRLIYLAGSITECASAVLLGWSHLGKIDEQLRDEGAQEVGELIQRPEAQEIYVQAGLHWLSVRKKRHLAIDVHLLSVMLEHQQESLQTAFSVTPSQIVEGFERLVTALICAKSEALQALKSLWKEFNQQATQDLTSFLKQRQEEFAPRVAAAHDLSSFDVKKHTNWPDALIRALSWRQGEASYLFKGSKKDGWPTTVLPFRQRPFLEVDGTSLCFDVAALTDNFYIVLQKAIRAANPALTDKWKVGQEQFSEAFSGELLRKILPGAISYNSLEYPIVSDKGNTGTAEVDNVILYDDVLFVIEAKGGAFSPASPIENFASYLSSFKALVKEPAFQCSRFIKYLNSDTEVPFYQRDARNKLQPAVTLRKSDYRLIVPIGLTVENFTHFAAQVERLDNLGLNLALKPFWSLAIDDLLAISTILTTPASFIHYVEKRLENITTEGARVFDEQDHLGLYLTLNQYGKAVLEKSSKQSNSTYVGFTRPIEIFFHDLYYDKSPTPPCQPTPPMFEAVIGKLERSSRKGWSNITSALLDMDSSGRERFEQLLKADTVAPCRLPTVPEIIFQVVPELDAIPEKATNLLSSWSLTVSVSKEGQVTEVSFTLPDR